MFQDRQSRNYFIASGEGEEGDDDDINVDEDETAVSICWLGRKWQLVVVCLYQKGKRKNQENH